MTMVRSAYAYGKPAAWDELVEQYAPLVKRIAYHLIARLPPNIQVDDLIQAGMIGLLDAASKFDAAHGASFETYAGTRIRGAMWDEVRRCGWTPRSLHRKARQAAEAIQQIENREGRAARSSEVAKLLDMTLDEYNRLLAESVASRVLSLDETGVLAEDSEPRGNTHEPFDTLDEEAFAQQLAQAIAALPERERLVVSLYYDEELNLREIGAVLGVSESRVCQIHGQALLRLRGGLKDWLTKD